MNETDLSFARKQFTRVGMGLFAFFGAVLTVQIVASVLTMIFAPHLLYESWFTMLISAVSYYGVGAPVAIIIMRTGPKCVFQPTKKMGFKGFLVTFCITYGITYVGNQIGTNLMNYVGKILGKEILNPLQSIPDGWGFVIEVIILLAAAPILEELLFRKCIIDAVLPYGEGTAIVLSAFTFGMAHGNFFQFFYAAGVGALFAYIYIRTGKIRNTMILHAALNFAGGFIPMVMNDWINELYEIIDSSSANQIIQNLSNMGPELVAVMSFSFIMLGVAISGIVITIVFRKEFFLNKPSLPIPSDKWFVTVFINVGTVLFVVFGTFLFISSVIG